MAFLPRKKLVCEIAVETFYEPTGLQSHQAIAFATQTKNGNKDIKKIKFLLVIKRRPNKKYINVEGDEFFCSRSKKSEKGIMILENKRTFQNHYSLFRINVKYGNNREWKIDDK